MIVSLSAFAPDNLASPDGFGSVTWFGLLIWLIYMRVKK